MKKYFEQNIVGTSKKEGNFESEESNEGFFSKSFDHLKKYWYVALLSACSPSQEDQATRFESVWQQLTSGRESGVVAEQTIKSRFREKHMQGKLMQDYMLYNDRLDSLLKLIPIDDLADYLKSLNVDLDKVSEHQEKYRILPAHLPDIEYLSGLTDREHESLLVNTAKISPEDTLKFIFTSTHELGHFFERASSEDLPQVVREGYAEYGAWRFLVNYLNKQESGNKNKVRKKLNEALEHFPYSGEAFIAAIHNVFEDGKSLGNYYNADMDTMEESFQQIIEAFPELKAVFEKDIRNEGTLKSHEVLYFIKHIISEHGQEKFKQVYSDLKDNYFIDIVTCRLGDLKWDGDIMFFDKTELESFNLPLKRHGEYSVLAGDGPIVRFVYDSSGSRDYKDILSKVKAGIDGQEEEIVVSVHPIMKLRRKDGAFREELSDILMTE